METFVEVLNSELLHAMGYQKYMLIMSWKLIFTNTM